MTETSCERSWSRRAHSVSSVASSAPHWAAVIALVIGGLANQYLESQGLAGVRLDIPLLLPLGAVLGATAVAIMAGVFPARRAARLPAREAMEA